MSLVTTFSVPKDWLPKLLPDYDIKGADSDWVKKQIKRIVEDAAAKGVIPIQSDTSRETVQINISLPGQVASVIRAGAKKDGVTIGPYCRYLLAGQIQIGVSGNGVDLDRCGVLGEVIQKLQSNLTIRPEQIEFYNQVRDSLRGNQIGLCEAATGTGKTIGILTAAIDILRESMGRLVIAVPTISIIEQFAREWRRLNQVIETFPMRLVIGRREFVSLNELHAFLATGKGEFDVVAVKEWVARAGISEDDDMGTSWLASSLLKICPDFPITEILLPEIVLRDDPGYLSYRAQFDADRNREAEIVVTTHAMLSIDLRRRHTDGRRIASVKDIEEEQKRLRASLKAVVGTDRALDINKSLRKIEREKFGLIADLTSENGLLPPYSMVVLDEAHLFEQNMSSALSEYVSLRAFARHLREYKDAGGQSPKMVIEEIERATSKISEIGGEKDIELYSLASKNGHAERFSALLASIANLAEKLPKPAIDASAATMALYIRISRDIATIKSAIRTDARSYSYLRLSEIRAYPQLLVGRKSVENFMKLLWSGVRSGAAVSATLYLRRGDEFTASYQRQLLAIPPDRFKEYSPASPAWLVRPVEGVWIPEGVQGENGRWLRPPSRLDKMNEKEHAEKEQKWLAEVATTVASIYESAAGGVLVAMTSYASIAYLAQALAPAFREVMVVADQDVKLQAQATRFIKLAASGVRPLWLATGAAWTGLDIGGHKPFATIVGHELAPEKDNVLTDLVVPRLPFRANRTITHLDRLERSPGVPWEVLETAFRIKQVMGRLVRRPGLPTNRRIFMLDGRFNDPQFTGMLTLIRNLFSIYNAKILKKLGDQ